MGFNPSAYLATLGWSGPGNGLTETSRKTPITILKKNNTFGIGRERDNSHPWWDDLFNSIALKLDQPKQPVPEQQQPPQQQKQQPVVVVSIPTTAPTSSSSALNLDAIHIAKRNAGRIELYRHFHRGTIIPGTDEPPPPLGRRVRFEEPLPTRWGGSTECNASVHGNKRSDQQHAIDLTDNINISVNDDVVALDEPRSKKRKSKVATDGTRKKKRKTDETTLPIQSKPHDSAAHDSIVVYEEPRSKKKKFKKKRDEADKKRSKKVKAEQSTTQETTHPVQVKSHDSDDHVTLEEPHRKKRKSKRRDEASDSHRKKKNKKAKLISHPAQETTDPVQVKSHDSADRVTLEEPHRKKRKSKRRDEANDSHRKKKSKKVEADEGSSSSLAAQPAENDLIQEEKKKKKKKKRGEDGKSSMQGMSTTSFPSDTYTSPPYKNIASKEAQGRRDRLNAESRDISMENGTEKHR
ncbi:hypothetical protein PCASD_07791 [Puccinia coronata f. sp. avenae]|uniref:G-patch domain-containing protein n=1 Tax=Puccinia coronata f. sp. avenae TaxID=200324 RepID=A0A2N5US36_9BASI|nr:hypothetical protein PCASD_11647 [Puccinia coronata f. sp. avenae]PLW40575.1 hypothetical protein PCASD_07791 [Puccinia coronata f. sp. avenae]